MSKKPETKFKERIRPLLEALPRTWFLKTQERTIRGIPDYLMCINGHFVALELKAYDDAEPDPLQDWNLAKITRSGGIAVTVTPGNWEQIYDILIQVATGRMTLKPEKSEAPILNG